MLKSVTQVFSYDAHFSSLPLFENMANLFCIIFSSMPNTLKVFQFVHLSLLEQLQYMF